MDEAITAYTDALAEQSRNPPPLYRAFSQTNLGAALVILGQRKKGTLELDEAVAILHEALTARTREDTPFLWAETQEKLALAHPLFDKGIDPTHRAAALDAIGGALDEYRRASAAFHIEKATRLRDKILAANNR